MTARTEIELAPVSLLALLAAYLFVDGVFVYLSSAQLGLYALLALSSGAVALGTLFGARFRPSELAIALVWLTAAAIWLLPPLAADYPYPRYVLTDFIALLLPAFLLIVGVGHGSLFTSRRALIALAVVMLLASVSAVPLAEMTTRHEPPPVLLMAMGWSVLTLSRSPAVRRAAILVLGILLVLAWTSGERTAVLLWLGLGVASRLFLVTQLRTLMLLAASAVAVMIVLMAAFGDLLLLAFASTRLEAISQGQLDTSLLNRVLEVRDVWRQWSPEYWFGFGHGATFAPELSYPPRNLTEHGRVHHIHFGPALLLFRYGIPGLLLYVWIVADLLQYVLRSARAGFAGQFGAIGFLFALALAGYLASFLVFTIIPDPAFSYTLAGYLYIRLTQPAPQPGELRSLRPVRIVSSSSS